MMIASCMFMWAWQSGLVIIATTLNWHHGQTFTGNIMDVDRSVGPRVKTNPKRDIQAFRHDVQTLKVACIAHDSLLHQDGERVDETLHSLINGRCLSVFPPGDSFQSCGIYFQMVIDSEKTVSMQQQFNNTPCVCGGGGGGGKKEKMCCFLLVVCAFFCVFASFLFEMG